MPAVDGLAVRGRPGRDGRGRDDQRRAREAQQVGNHGPGDVVGDGGAVDERDVPRNDRGLEPRPRVERRARPAPRPRGAVAVVVVVVAARDARRGERQRVQKHDAEEPVVGPVDAPPGRAVGDDQRVVEHADAQRRGDEPERGAPQCAPCGRLLQPLGGAQTAVERGPREEQARRPAAGQGQRVVAQGRRRARDAEQPPPEH